ncbi:MAG: HAD family hydrolase [archaeon]|nr:HAD family hydrolase [archaeon]
MMNQNDSKEEKKEIIGKIKISSNSQNPSIIGANNKKRGNSVNPTKIKQSHQNGQNKSTNKNPNSLIVSNIITQVQKDAENKPLYSPLQNNSTNKKGQDQVKKSHSVPPKKGVVGHGFDLLPERETNKKTLVLDLDETLVHSAFTPFPCPSDVIIQIEIDNEIHDIHVLVRPGVKEFLEEMAKHYEIVIFTASLSKYADPLLDIIDKQGYCPFRLFREHCTLINSTFVKDLVRLGRNLKDIVIVDNSPLSYALNPDNGIPILSWYEDKSDKELYHITPILQFLAYVPDVRDYIKKFVLNNELNYVKAVQIINAYKAVQARIPKRYNNNINKTNESEDKSKSESTKVLIYEGRDPENDDVELLENNEIDDIIENNMPDENVPTVPQQINIKIINNNITNYIGNNNDRPHTNQNEEIPQNNNYNNENEEMQENEIQVDNETPPENEVEVTGEYEEEENKEKEDEYNNLRGQNTQEEEKSETTENKQEESKKEEEKENEEEKPEEELKENEKESQPRRVITKNDELSEKKNKVDNIFKANNANIIKTLNSYHNIGLNFGPKNKKEKINYFQTPKSPHGKQTTNFPQMKIKKEQTPQQRKTPKSLLYSQTSTSRTSSKNSTRQTQKVQNIKNISIFTNQSNRIQPAPISVSTNYGTKSVHKIGDPAIMGSGKPKHRKNNFLKTGYINTNTTKSSNQGINTQGTALGNYDLLKPSNKKNVIRYTPNLVKNFEVKASSISKNKANIRKLSATEANIRLKHASTKQSLTQEGTPTGKRNVNKVNISTGSNSGCNTSTHLKSLSYKIENGKGGNYCTVRPKSSSKPSPYYAQFQINKKNSKDFKVNLGEYLQKRIVSKSSRARDLKGGLKYQQ